MLLLIFFIFSSVYYVDFRDVSGIEEGMGIYYKGIQIGKVEEIFIKDLKPGVKISVKRKYKNLMREGCGIRFYGGKLELFSVDEGKEVLPSGSELKGVRNPVDEVIFGFKKMKDKFKNSKVYDEFQEVLDEMDRAYEKGKEEFKEKWPYFKEKLKNLKEKIKGDKKMEEEMEKTIEEGDKKSSS
ncbi:MAG: MlaD family protein [Thermoanaerobaculia bacterium]